MVSNDRRTKLLPKILLGQTFVGLIVVLLAMTVIFYGQGYRLNFHTLEIEKTGVLFLNFLPKDVTVQVNSKKDRAITNFAQNFTPGFYDVTISKQNYTPWHASLYIESSSVNVYQNIILFKSEITPSLLTDQGKIDLLKIPDSSLALNAPDQLAYNDYEIWIGNKLVTRFSQKLQKAIWYPDLAHVIYQQGAEIRVIDSDGKNDLRLVNLSSTNPTSFAIGNRGSELYYIDGTEYKIAEIR